MNLIDEFGLKGIPKENKGKLTFFGIDKKYFKGNSNSHENDIIIILTTNYSKFLSKSCKI